MEKTGKSSLSFGAIFGDEAVEKIVWPYIYGENGILDILDQIMPEEKYGEDLKLINIMLYVEGEHNWFKMPDVPKLGRYSEREKAFRYDVPVTQQTFFTLPPADRKEFIIKQMHDAIKEAQTRNKKKNMKIDFPKMLVDLGDVIQAYRNRTPPP